MGDLLNMEEYRQRKMMAILNEPITMANGSTVTFKDYGQGREPFKSSNDDDLDRITNKLTTIAIDQLNDTLSKFTPKK